MYQLWLLNSKHQYQPIGRLVTESEGKGWLKVLIGHFPTVELQLQPEGTPAQSVGIEGRTRWPGEAC